MHKVKLNVLKELFRKKIMLLTKMIQEKKVKEKRRISSQILNLKKLKIFLFKKIKFKRRNKKLFLKKSKKKKKKPKEKEKNLEWILAIRNNKKRLRKNK